MKVKVIKDYMDTQLNRLVKVDEELDVSDSRAKRLIEANVANALTTPTTEKVAKGKSRKKVDE